MTSQFKLNRVVCLTDSLRSDNDLTTLAIRLLVIPQVCREALVPRAHDHAHTRLYVANLLCTVHVLVPNLEPQLLLLLKRVAHGEVLLEVGI